MSIRKLFKVLRYHHHIEFPEVYQLGKPATVDRILGAQIECRTEHKTQIQERREQKRALKKQQRQAQREQQRAQRGEQAAPEQAPTAVDRRMQTLQQRRKKYGLITLRRPADAAQLLANAPPRYPVAEINAMSMQQLRTLAQHYQVPEPPPNVYPDPSNIDAMMEIRRFRDAIINAQARHGGPPPRKKRVNKQEYRAVAKLSRRRLASLAEALGLSAPPIDQPLPRRQRERLTSDIMRARQRIALESLFKFPTPSKQAAKILARFGGPAALSEALRALPESRYHRTRTVVYKWLYPKERGGADGMIPHQAVIAVKMAARMQGIFLTPEEWAP